MSRRIVSTSSTLSDPSSSSPSFHPSTMLDALHGWSPIGGDDEDVNISQNTCFIGIKPFHSQSDTFFGAICPPLDATLKTRSPQSHPHPHPHSHPLPSAPLTGIPHSSIAPSSDRRAHRNRNRDPSWIPRPRNAFIIFRCEYSREHSQGSQESQSDDESVNTTAKTLSKRAANAWKQLPASERERYKVLADKEREEHARLYPHYRFRPMKRQVSVTGKTSQERSHNSRMPSVERPPTSSTHLPSVLSRAPRSSSTVDRTDASPVASHVGPLSLPDSIACPIDPRPELRMPASLSSDYNDPLLSCSLPEESLPYITSSPTLLADLYAPLSRSAAFSIPADAFTCNDTTSGVNVTQEDTERAEALEAYAIGLYNYDLFPPFSIPEFY